MSTSTVIKGLKTTAAVIAAVSTVVDVAVNLKDKVQPAVESEETKAAVKKSIQSLTQYIEKYSTSRELHVEARSQKKASRELAKQLKEGRQIVLESASQVVLYKELSKYCENKGPGSAALKAGLLSGPGCFVIGTFAPRDFDKDLTDYVNVYVGKGENLKDAIIGACSRDGDPDVYADVKYKQNVKIFVYLCSQEQLEEKYNALFALFQSTDEEGKITHD